MKKLLTLSLFCASAFVGMHLYNDAGSEYTSTEKVEKTLPQEHRPAAIRWNMLRSNVETGKFEPEDMKKAQQEVAKWRADNSAKVGSLVDWQELGPNNVGGRTRSIHFDVNDSNIMYTGGVTGGFWKSTDGASSWSLSQSSVNIGCTNVTSITQTSDGTIYAGTGSSFEFVFQALSANVGTGVFKSTDGGETFSQAAGTGSWNAVNRLVADGNRIFAATNSGLYVSDNGSNWSKPTGLTISAIASDVHVTSDGTVYAAVGNIIAKSTDGGDSFSAIPASNFVTGATSNRKVFASCEAEPDVVYIAYLVGSCDVDIYQTKDAGSTFDRVADGGVAFSPVGVTGSGICQGSYDLALAVSPTNPDEIYIGGLTLWKWTPTEGAYQVDNYYGDIFSDTYVHADKHVIAYKPGSADEMFIGCDGGIFKTNDASSIYPIYQHKSKGLNTVQFYSVGAGLDGSVVGGAQDNGTSLMDYTFNSFQAAQDVAGGDGAYCDISNINPNIILASSQEGAVVLSTNGGEGFGSFLNGGSACSNAAGSPSNPPGCASDGPDEDGDGAMDGANFIQAFELWEDTRLYNAIINAEIPKDGDGNAILPHTVFYGNQTFVITDDFDLVNSQIAGHPGSTICNPDGNDCFKSASNYANFQQGAVNVYTEAVLYIAYDRETSTIVPSPKFIRSKFVMGNAGGDMWMTYDLLDLGVTPFFVHLGRYNGSNTTAGGNIHSMAFSEDGDHVFFGTTTGRVTRVSGLNDQPENPLIENVSNQVITGISVNPSFPQRVVVSAANTGTTANIYRSTNALNSSVSYESIQGDLPNFPLYDCTYTGGTSNDVLVAGEFGVWLGKDNGTGDLEWTEENGLAGEGKTQLGIIPVDRIRSEHMVRNNSIPDFKTSDYMAEGDLQTSLFLGEVDCRVIYIGTHGRGAFRTTSFSGDACADVVALAPISATDATDIDRADYGVNIYPNPAKDVISIDFEVEELTRVKVNIYDIQGRLITTADDLEAVGKQSIRTDVSNLAAGNYIIALETAKGSDATQITVVK